MVCKSSEIVCPTCSCLFHLAEHFVAINCNGILALSLCGFIIAGHRTFSAALPRPLAVPFG